uniref:Uncharacterized protein n=1 Tax=Anguilla anguilla TaxID=7936 RepID=A0A0E9U8V4_ANGAN
METPCALQKHYLYSESSACPRFESLIAVIHVDGISRGQRNK